MTSGQPPYSLFRRKRFVLYGFQSRYALVVVVLSMFITVMTGLVIYRLFAGPEMESPLQLLEANGAIDRRAIWLVAGVAVLMLCSFFFFYAMVIVATHRVAGPILLMTRYMKELAQGQYPRMRDLRQGDELKEFFALFRATVDRFREKTQLEADLLGKAVAALTPLGSTAEAQAALQSLGELRDSKMRALSPPPVSMTAESTPGMEKVPLPTTAR